MLGLRFLYTGLMYLLLPFILLRLYWKGRHLPAYRLRIPERLMLHRSTLSPVDVWLHAVSLGEVVAATPLIEALLERGWSVAVTTTTPTGSQQVQEKFMTHVAHQYLPYDFPWAIKQFYNQIKPKVAIIMETEIWPNVILEAKFRGIPIIIANARISEKAWLHYHSVRGFFKPILNQLTAILAQSQADLLRFESLGADKDRIKLLGNMKFDALPKIEQPEICQQVKNGLGPEKIIILLASTHDQEEAMILAQWPQLLSVIPNAVLWIAPRHPERFNRVVTLCHNTGLRTMRRSQPELIDGTTQVIVLDSIGELLGFYACCDYAFVGGSLVPMIGGHNVLEPIAVGIPVFCGQFMQNSKQICDELLSKGALQQVLDAAELIEKIIFFHQHPEKKKLQITRATQVLQANQGSVMNHLQLVEKLLNRPDSDVL